MESIIQNFFNREDEIRINEKMMYYDYQFPKEKVSKYINDIINIPLENFINFVIYKIKVSNLTPDDICQFSNFEKCTDLLCKILIKNGDKGVNYFECGALLLNDGVTRKKNALIKYGENQLKTGRMLGLIYSVSHTFYVGCIGYVYITLPEEKKEKLLRRLLLRAPLFCYIIQQALNKKVVLKELLNVISETTYQRRKGNIKRLFGILFNSDEYDFSKIKDNLEW